MVVTSLFKYFYFISLYLFHRSWKVTASHVSYFWNLQMVCARLTHHLYLTSPLILPIGPHSSLSPHYHINPLKIILLADFLTSRSRIGPSFWRTPKIKVNLFPLLGNINPHFVANICMRTQTVRCYAENLGSLSEKGIDSIAAIRKINHHNFSSKS